VIYGHAAKKRGQFGALDATKGKINWASEGRVGDYASVLLLLQNFI